ncbi:MAG: UDP-N-acetylmuramoyl-tripeptide--D-alanyl-D-alanine ligase [Thermoanaerobaculaceae bacterium]
MRQPLSVLASWLRLPAPPGAEGVLVEGVSFDSRQVRPGNLFVAVSGNQTDGHLFVEHAYRQGAVAALVSRPSGAPLPQLLVPDTVAALQTLASRVRQEAKFRLVAVTGSVGKTTTKAMLASLLRCRYRVGETQGSRNSQVGLPTEILNLHEDVDWFVAEAGMSQEGELARLGKVLRPQALLYTRIAPVHLEFFPSLAAIAEAKAELLSFLETGGTLVINADDPWQTTFPQRFSGLCRSYGSGDTADLRLERLTLHGLLGSRFLLVGDGLRQEIFLPLAGRHQAENFLAAACMALSLGVSPQEVGEAAASLEPQPHRGRVLQLNTGVTLVDDSYNASPTAVQAMLELLAQSPGRRVAVLGEMLELGKEGPAFHRQVGEAARGRCELLFTIGGANARVTAEVFGGQWYATVEEAIPQVEMALRPGDVVLVKGSRGIGLDRLVAALLEGKS